MAVTYETLAPYVAEEAYGAPITLIEEAVRDAAIDFCKDSGIYRTTLSMTLTSGQSEYSDSDLGPPSGTRIDHFEHCWYGRQEIEDTDYEDIFRRDGTGDPQWFAAKPDHDGFRIYPEPTDSTTDTLYFLVTLVPTRDSTDIPDWLADYYRQAIITRAKYLLLRDGKNEWGNPQLAQQRLVEYSDFLKEAKRNAFLSRGANRRIRQTPFA